MTTSKSINEQVSAFADGETDGLEVEQLMKTLREPEARAAWDRYHAIGDALRSSDVVRPMSADFMTRMAARLAAEPNHIGAPAGVAVVKDVAATALPGSGVAAAGTPAWKSRFLKFGMPGAAMAAAILLAVTLGPRSDNASMAGSPDLAAGGKSAARVIVAAGQGGHEVLRDARIDEYLLAHQRSSPSLYSTAHYARPSTFATESVK